MDIDHLALWKFLPVGYVLTILLETPILLLGLSRRHSISRRLIAGIWLTACTYPIVVLVLPLLVEAHFGRWIYVGTAEIFAPVAECILFWFAFRVENQDGDSTTATSSARDTCQDMVAIVAANICSWLLGGWLLRSFE